MTVAQKFRKNTKITITTSATVSTRVKRTSLTEARMVSVRSDSIETLMSFGIAACSWGSIALTRSTVAMSNDQLVIGIRTEELVVGVDGVGSPRAIEGSLWLIDIGLAYDVAYIFETDAARGKRLRIDLNPDGGLLLAADGDEADSGYLRNFLEQDIFSIGVDRGQRQRIRS